MARRRLKSKQQDTWINTFKTIKFANSPVSQNIDDLKVPTLGLTEKYVHDNEKNNKRKIRFSYFSTILNSFKNPFTLILVAIAIYNFAMYGAQGATDFTYLAGGLLVTALISISIIFDVFTNRSIFKGNIKLSVHNVEYTKVLRNVLLNQEGDPISSKDVEDQMISRLAQVRNRDLLIGDVIYLEKGDIIPADVKILHSTNLTVNQEVLSGNRNPIPKKSTNSSLSTNPLSLTNVAYRGSLVVTGTAWAIVLYKGINTFYENKVVDNIPNEENSSFNGQVKKVTRILIWTLVIFVPTIFILVGLLSAANSKPPFQDPLVWVNAIIFSMAIAVALSPDALPFMLNAVFARSRIVLAKKQVTISNLSSVQNIGAMDVMAIDIEKIFLNDEFVIRSYADINGYNNKKILSYFILTLFNDPIANKKIGESVLNDPNFKDLIKELQERYKFIDKVVSYGKTYLRFTDTKLQKILLVRRGGAGESLQSSTEFDNGKAVQKLTDYRKNKVSTNKFYVDGPFSFGISYQVVNDTKTNENKTNSVPNDFIYLGNIQFANTVKAGSNSIIQHIQKENINVVLISKQPLAQALAACYELGFTVNDSMSGVDIQSMSDSQIMRKLNKVNLFYDMSINTQVRLIKIYKKNGNIIGYLGKDINDSFQLLTADIGITLDNSDYYGKKCSSLIINHLDLMQLVVSIVESRRALVNMMKYIKMKITATVSLTMKLVIGIILFNHEPMSAIQLLVQNLLYDGIEYSVAFDKVNNNYLKKPAKWNIKSIIPFVAMNSIIIVLANLIVTIITVFGIYGGTFFKDVRNAESSTSWQIIVLQTTYFVEDSISHLIFIFVARDNYKNWWKERPAKITWWTLIGGVIFFILISVIPGVDTFFQTATPKWEWYIVLIIEMIILMSLIDLLKRFYLKKHWTWL